ncbi:MAG: hypothetical protein KDE22_08335 [Rhodobacterales bacterium]|nr:hypothetical protein [Rhodobacterales bacterium]
MSLDRMTGPVALDDLRLAGAAALAEGDGSRERLADILMVVFEDDWMKATAVMLRFEALLDVAEADPRLAALVPDGDHLLTCEAVLRAVAEQPLEDLSGDGRFDADALVEAVRAWT